MPAVYFLQIICFSGMLYPLHAINLNILQVKGRSDLFLKLEIIKKIIATIPIVIGIFWGIELMLWGSVCTSFIAFFLNSYYSAPLIGYPTLQQIKDVVPTFCVSLGVACIDVELFIMPLSYYIMFLLQFSVGIIAFILIYEWLRLSE